MIFIFYEYLYNASLHLDIKIIRRHTTYEHWTTQKKNQTIKIYKIEKWYSEKIYSMNNNAINMNYIFILKIYIMSAKKKKTLFVFLDIHYTFFYVEHIIYWKRDYFIQKTQYKKTFRLPYLVNNKTEHSINHSDKMICYPTPLNVLYILFIEI